MEVSLKMLNSGLILKTITHAHEMKVNIYEVNMIGYKIYHIQSGKCTCLTIFFFEKAVKFEIVICCKL